MTFFANLSNGGKYVFSVESVKNDSTFLFLLYTNGGETASYFALFSEQSSATRFTCFNCTRINSQPRLSNEQPRDSFSTVANENRVSDGLVFTENCPECARLSKNDTSKRARRIEFS